MLIEGSFAIPPICAQQPWDAQKPKVLRRKNNLISRREEDKERDRERERETQTDRVDVWV